MRVLCAESWQFYSPVDVPNDPYASKKSVVHIYIYIFCAARVAKFENDSRHDDRPRSVLVQHWYL